MSSTQVGPLLFTPQDKPYYRRGIIAIVSCFCGCALFTVLTAVYLWHLNERNRSRRLARGKCKRLVQSQHPRLTSILAGKMVDYSMLSTTEMENVMQNNPDIDVGGERAFDDLTDLCNDEFIVSPRKHSPTPSSNFPLSMSIEYADTHERFKPPASVIYISRVFLIIA